MQEVGAESESKITIEQLKKAHWSVLYFASGSDPKHIQAYQCREFPRLTKTSVKPKRGEWRTVYAVDGIEIERGADTGAWLQALVNALNTQARPIAATATGTE